MYLSDITDYNKTSDYLSILNGILFVGTIVMLLVFCKIISPNIIYKWYSIYKLYAVIVDVTTIFLTIIITRYVYFIWKQTNNAYGFTYSWSVFIAIALFSQLCYDLLLYFIIQHIPIGSNQMIDIFRKYTKESIWYIFTLDISFVLFAILFASLFNSYGFNINIIILILLLNIIPFILFTNRY
jgi:hypothetical protein